MVPGPAVYDMKQCQSPSHSNIESTLLFGECDAARQNDYKVLGDRMNLVYPGVNAYEPIGSPRAFSSKMNTLKLPAIQAVAVVMSPSYIDRSSTQRATLKVPLSGEFNCFLDGRFYQCGAGLGALYYPQSSGQVKGSGGSCSQVSFQFEPLLLEKTARAMLGLPANAVIDLQLENPRMAPLTVAGRPFSTVLQHVGALIDLHQRDARVLTQLGLQDTLYRHIAMVLCPEAFLSPPSRPRTTSDSAALIAQLCDYMQAHLESNLTLTDLEIFCGLSARSLQLAFKKQLGVSPMQWLRQQRLDFSRQTLLHANPDTTVIQVALYCGFASPSKFSMYYKQRFGESPSITLAKVLAG